jgi:hypothetical protein
MPDISVKQLEEISGIDVAELIPQPEQPPFSELAESYKKLKIPPTRFAYKAALNMINHPGTELTGLNQKILHDLKIDISALIKDLSIVIPVDKTKANVDYEELECVALDYNTESLVATIKDQEEGGLQR